MMARIYAAERISEGIREKHTGEECSVRKEVE
jgi:hypothetical protein